MANFGDYSVGSSDAAGTRFGMRCREFGMSVTQTTSYVPDPNFYRLQRKIYRKMGKL